MSTKIEFQTVVDFVVAEISDQAEFIYLMGSFGTDRFNDQSDLDFAVFWKNNPELSELIKIKSKFEDHFQRDVELVSLNKIDIIFAAQVLETGRLIFLNESNKGTHLNWRAQKMSEYPDFKFSRKVIEENILVRKKYV
jgi:predicted nucleotidyltransferase